MKKTRIWHLCISCSNLLYLLRKKNVLTYFDLFTECTSHCVSTKFHEEGFRAESTVRYTKLPYWLSIYRLDISSEVRCKLLARMSRSACLQSQTDRLKVYGIRKTDNTFPTITIKSNNFWVTYLYWRYTYTIYCIPFVSLKIFRYMKTKPNMVLSSILSNYWSNAVFFVRLKLPPAATKADPFMNLIVLVKYFYDYLHIRFVELETSRSLQVVNSFEHLLVWQPFLAIN